jgi:nucleoside-diphosphate-sugar epimerase
MRETLAAIRHLEDAVVDAGGIVLRYGGFYGAPDDAQIELVRKRRFPIVGDGGGIWSFVHLDDAAAATVLALERGEPGIYNVVDDEPASVRVWLPALAAALGAKPPRRVPRWLARIAAGESGGRADDGGQGRLERQGEARARLAARPPELADRLRRLLQARERRREHVGRELDVLVRRELVGVMRDAAVLAADEQHRALDAGDGEDARVVPGA